MWEKYLLCFLPPPYEAIEIHHAEQNNGDDRRKGLTKEESKSRDTQSSEQKRDETRYFAAKGQIGEDSAWGSNYEMHMQKALVPPKRVHWAKTCPMKEGGEVNETHERFLPVDPDSPVPLSAKQKRGMAVESWKQWQAQCISLCMNSCSIFCRNFFATQISREQHNQISTPPFMNRC